MLFLHSPWFVAAHLAVGGKREARIWWCRTPAPTKKNFVYFSHPVGFSSQVYTDVWLNGKAPTPYGHQPGRPVLRPMSGRGEHSKQRAGHCVGVVGDPRSNRGVSNFFFFGLFRVAEEVGDKPVKALATSAQNCAWVINS
jgi:hypothetical protein